MAVFLLLLLLPLQAPPPPPLVTRKPREDHHRRQERWLVLRLLFRLRLGPSVPVLLDHRADQLVGDPLVDVVALASTRGRRPSWERWKVLALEVLV